MSADKIEPCTPLDHYYIIEEILTVLKQNKVHGSWNPKFIRLNNFGLYHAANKLIKKLVTF